MTRADDHPATRALQGTERAAVPDGSRRAAIGRRSFMAGVGAGVVAPKAASAAGTAASFEASHGPAQASAEPSFERFFDDRLPALLEAYEFEE